MSGRYWISTEQLAKIVALSRNEKAGKELVAQIKAQSSDLNRECAEFICDAILAGATFESAWAAWEKR